MSDSDYTFIEQALSLGGHLVRSVELSTGEVMGGESAEHRADVRSTERSAERPLSKSHIGPQTKPPSISWRAGASVLKASQGSNGERKGGGARQSIKGFSSDSRRRLLVTIGSIRRDADLPCFVTLTYPNEFPTPQKSKRHLKMFCQRLKRAFPDVGAVWKLEPQERGAPHYHLLVWGASEVSLREFVPSAWHEIAGASDPLHLLFHLGRLPRSQHCVNQVRSWQGVWSYAAKYLGKTFEVAGWGELWTGRFWGFVNREAIPFGPLCELELPKKKVAHIMRYQRRFAHRRKASLKGFTLFCDADQWIEKLSLGGDLVSDA